MIEVLALVPYALRRVGGQRYRMEQWARLLRDEGIGLTFAPFLSEDGTSVLYERGHVFAKARETMRGYVRRLRELRARAAPDVVYVFREATLLGPPWFERLHARRRPIVFDFDDAIYLPNASEANAWTHVLKPRRKTQTLCELADRVMVGNEVLAEFASVHSKKVTVVPSTVDTDLYTVRARASNAVPVVGWTGSLSTLPHLRLLAPALRRLRQKMPFELRVIGGQLSIDGVEVRCRTWREESEVEDLRPLDVGVMPLPDDEWSRGKCGMKALQYMALAIPPVVSPVGANAAIVTDGVNGFHARSDDEWVERMASLLADADLRRRLGAAARATVETRYSARAQAPRVAEVLRAAAG